jgi:hypothetical protein
VSISFSLQKLLLAIGTICLINAGNGPISMGNLSMASGLCHFVGPGCQVSSDMRSKVTRPKNFLPGPNTEIMARKPTPGGQEGLIGWSYIFHVRSKNVPLTDHLGRGNHLYGTFRSLELLSNPASTPHGHQLPDNIVHCEIPLLLPVTRILHAY